MEDGHGLCRDRMFAHAKAAYGRGITDGITGSLTAVAIIIGLFVLLSGLLS